MSDAQLSCLPRGRDDDGAVLAQCRNSDVDLGVEIVRSGMGTSYACFSNVLQVAESRARREGLGLWRGDWVHPSVWRDGVRLGEAPCQGCYITE